METVLLQEEGKWTFKACLADGTWGCVGSYKWFWPVKSYVMTMYRGGERKFRTSSMTRGRIW